jgi:hypothetical protein
MTTKLFIRAAISHGVLPWRMSEQRLSFPEIEGAGKISLNKTLSISVAVGGIPHR